jgi:hypothetical protein
MRIATKDGYGHDGAGIRRKIFAGQVIPAGVEYPDEDTKEDERAPSVISATDVSDQRTSRSRKKASDEE